MGADPYLVSKIQEYNSRICKDAADSEEMQRLKEEDTGKIVEELKESYRRSSKC